MSYVVAGEAVQVPPGTMKSFMVSGKKLLVTNIDGRFYAINSICTHAGGDLSKGKLDGNVVTCPRHGSRFDVTTGQALSGPKFGFVKFNTASEPSYAVKVEDGKIMVDIAA
jgi:nitrite reductase/ring-hydroxylating ferredoxin subunit